MTTNPSHTGILSQDSHQNSPGPAPKAEKPALEKTGKIPDGTLPIPGKHS